MTVEKADISKEVAIGKITHTKILISKMGGLIGTEPFIHIRTRKKVLAVDSSHFTVVRD